jgi:hypothetical protein
LDCEASCPGAGGLSPLPFDQDEEFEIAGFYGLGFIMCIVYFVLAVSFVVLLLVLRKVKCAFSLDITATDNQMCLLGEESQKRGPLIHIFLFTTSGIPEEEYFCKCILLITFSSLAMKGQICLLPFDCKIQRISAN